jgi:biopolymer transport protein ExbD
MRFMSPNEDYGNETVDINLSPLIDMVFLLLIFFMVTTVFVKRSALDITPPDAATAGAAPESAIVFNITGDGIIRFGDSEISLASVPGVYKRQMGNIGRPVVVVADRQTPTGAAVAVVDTCRAAGAQQVSLATRNTQR